jgi:hypothetical protein
MVGWDYWEAGGGGGLRMTGSWDGMSEGVENRGDCKKKTSYGKKRPKQRREELQFLVSGTVCVSTDGRCRTGEFWDGMEV